MKKFLALIFAILMIVSCFAACGNNENVDDTSTTSSSAENLDDTSTTSSGVGNILIPEEDLKGVEYGSFKKFTAVDLAGRCTYSLAV